ncbi:MULTISPECIES: pitrilysin family protein [unclassified Vibrio]|uniref:M16 family metallopeptidase n=1 Tax=unclassified Vibrio TaxID=2614977 RepID=UPI0027C9A8E9|nr:MULTISPECIES: M16 family metallopeptidase [unclassified Vibrio]MDQ2109946.1 insulinase family protein [Vibrio sp. 2017_1457_15]MDQ2162759.1 insulinase family protein [Vibrio sp. 2017_1457_13]MDQ2193148.1 insulinase family protein [Vibrio sp. A14(2019)]
MSLFTRLMPFFGACYIIMSLHSVANELTPDPRIHQGRLANGLTYQLMVHPYPKKAIIMRMQIAGGSLVESEQQQGLMHLLEHMAFNGSRSVPQGDMIAQLEKLGLSFGSDTNAITEHHQTVYQFNIIEGSQDKLTTGLMLMREIGDQLTLTPEALAQEKPIVMAEIREKQSIELDNYQHQQAFLYPDSPLASRLPIGLESAVSQATVAQLRDLYQRFYTPERTTIIVVGDIDIAATERQIQQGFANWQPHPQAVLVSDDPLPTLTVQQELRADSFFDPRLPTTVTLGMLQPQDVLADGIARRHRMLNDWLIRHLLYRRLTAHLPEEDMGRRVNVALFEEFKHGLRFELSLNSAPHQWRESLTLLEQTMRQALVGGFTEQEVNRALDLIEQDIQHALAQPLSVNSFGLAEQLVDFNARGLYFLDPKQEWALFQQLKPSLTASALHEALKQRWQGEPWIYLTHSQPEEQVAKELLSVYQQSQQQPISAHQEQKLTPFAYANFGKPGKVIADQRDEQAGIRQLVFANGVRLSLRPTQFELGQAIVQLKVGFGDVALPKSEGLTTLFQRSFVLGGLAEHSYAELGQILAGQGLAVGWKLSEQGFNDAVSVRTERLRAQLGLHTAFLIAPGFRPEALHQFRQQVREHAFSRHTNAETLFWQRFAELLHPEDINYALGRDQELLKRDFSEIAPVLASAVDRGLLEVTIVGDIDESQAIQAVAETLGALERHPLPITKRPVVARLPELPASRQLSHQGAVDSTALAWIWPNLDSYSVEQAAKILLLDRVLQLLITEELRVQTGMSYSPYTFNSSAKEPSELGYIGLFALVDRQHVLSIEGKVDTLIEQLGSGQRIDADLLARAKQPLLQSIAHVSNSNGFWLEATAMGRTQPEYYQRVQQIYDHIAAADIQSVQTSAQRYLSKDKCLKVITSFGESVD